MPGLLFVGDPHGEFGPVFDRAAELGPEAIILLGDQAPESDGLLALLEKVAPVYYILGNHDTDTVREGPEDEPAYPYLERHLAELPRDRDLTGRVVTLGGYRVAGLGGIFRSKVWEPQKNGVRYETRQRCRRDTPRHTRYRNGPPAKQWSSIWPEDYAALERQQAHILVTHEAPESHHHGYRELGDLARTMGVRAHVHGHHHTGYQARIEGGVLVTGTAVPGQDGAKGVVTQARVLGEAAF
ncbi:hypothetical protein AN478_07005 [Thiohalorhabdus denitrificans]|uniref:Predicted phosphoesterase n=1 Tax=Thiohalorhabdus denitrificans TaxID=381306 RepID=A0A0P9GIT6_9GAMM|nr:metallophosphoesterase [Thiohalorhabdus denitrificans]KPV39939.1 hypothetical protein AN478_07005 [Thiohalorhabdus denitrificans]SCY09133.1 Predicted phosphoesterase [Thiohalorhabdus denitrificans]